MPIEQEIKQTKPLGSPYQKLMVNLLFSGAWTKDITNRHFKTFGLSNEQFNVLRILRGSNPNPLAVSDVQNRMVEKSSNVGRMVDKLLEKELVGKETNAANRRMIHLSITTKGLELLSEIDTAFHNLDKRFFNLNENEINQLIGLLDKLRG